jgi:hypothetical protein
MRSFCTNYAGLNTIHTWVAKGKIRKMAAYDGKSQNISSETISITCNHHQQARTD